MSSTVRGRWLYTDYHAAFLAGGCGCGHRVVLLPEATGDSRIIKQNRFIYTLLENKYYFDRFNDWFFAAGARNTSRLL
jgi:hypothetical protein